MAEDARILYANEQACRSLGYSRAELLRLTIHDIDLDFPRSQWPAWWRELKERGARTIESRHRRKDGSVFPVESAVNYFVYNGKEYNCAFARDITERKTVEAKLREREQHFRVLAESLAVATFIYQAEAIRYVNARAQTLTGYSAAELLGMKFWELLHPEFQDLARRRGLARLKGAPVPAHYEVKIRTKGGEDRWVDFTAGLIELNGEPAVLGIAVDITDRKEADAARKRLCRDLLDTLERERRRVAMELHDGVGQVLVALSLELYALRRAGGEKVEVERCTLEEMGRQIAEAAESIAHLAHHYHPVELVGLGVGAAIEAFAKDLARRHGVAVSVAADDIAGLLDQESELHLYRLLQEALNNAAKHAHAREIKVAIRREGQWLRATVSDDGKGFETKPMSAGTRGFGLTTMRERAAIIDGKLAVSSAKGVGTTVEITVPTK